MRAPDGNVITTVATGAQTPFRLYGGNYVTSAHSAAWNAGNAQLQALGPDNATWMNIGSAISADGQITAALALPPGQYRWLLTTTVAATLSVLRVETE